MIMVSNGKVFGLLRVKENSSKHFQDKFIRRLKKLVRPSIFPVSR